MHVVIAYESVYGNTHEIAEAIGEGVRDAVPQARVSCVPVGDAGTDMIRSADLLVVGGPTHMHGMSTALSRRMGISAEQKKIPEQRHEIDPAAGGPGVRDWLRGLRTGSGALRAATFDTRADSRMAGGAAPSIARALRRHGYDIVTEPQGFFIVDSEGPLREGERDRARSWGAALMHQPVR